MQGRNFLNWQVLVSLDVKANKADRIVGKRKQWEPTVPPPPYPFFGDCHQHE